MSFRKRGERWYYTIETKDENGKRRRIERSGGRTKGECERAYRLAMADIDAGRAYSEPANMTVSALLDAWMNEYVERNRKANTIRIYKSAVENHIKPSLGEMKISAVTGRTLQNFLNEKKEKYSRNTVGVFHAVLKDVFSWAVLLAQYLKENPAQGIRVPTFEEAPKETHVFSPEQLQAIFRKFGARHQFYLPVQIAYHTGMRLGEILALSWSDVDMEKNVIHVHSTLVNEGNKAFIQAIPKTSGSIRNVPFGVKLYRVLKAAHAKQAENRLRYGSYYSQTENDSVCVWQDGHQLTASDLRFFGQYCKKTFGEGGWHSLRHTHATMLLEAGEDLELVSKRLGHSGIAITAKVYSHVLEKRNAHTVALLDKIL